MRKLMLAAFISAFAFAGSLFAQMPTTVAVDEISGKEDGMGPYSKLLSEYVITELAACNLVKVVGFDTVNNVKADQKIVDIRKADTATLNALLGKLKANAICIGSLSRIEGRSAKIEISVFKDGAYLERKATGTMKSIEDADETAKSLALQLEAIIKGWPAPRPTVEGVPAPAPSSN